MKTFILDQKNLSDISQRFAKAYIFPKPPILLNSKRTPFGMWMGAFKDADLLDLAAWNLKALQQNALEERSFPNEKCFSIDAFIVGCVLPAGLGQNYPKQCLFKGGFPSHINASAVNKVCGSGLYSHILAAIFLQNECHQILAGGMEMMSKAPYLWPRQLPKYGNVNSIDSLMHDGLLNAFVGDEENVSVAENTYTASVQSMGVLAQHCANLYSISREEQDAYLEISLGKSLQSLKNGFFKKECITLPKPYQNIIEDEKLHLLSKNPEDFLKKIKTLRPAFEKDGSITAASASPLADGTCFSFLISQHQAKQLQTKGMSRLLAWASASQNPQDFLLSPILAIEALLKALNWRVQDVDCFEINEAFAIAPILAARCLEIPFEKINPNGGACLLGHPLGASGARILSTLAHHMEDQKLHRGVAAICIGGGEGLAVALERP